MHDVRPARAGALRRRGVIAGALVQAVVACSGAAAALPDGERLPSWRASAVRAAVLQFVDDVSNPSSPAFVEAARRIAVFDNDGTLWSEQPTYFQLSFVADRIRDMAPAHPEWKEQEPYRSVLAGDLRRAAAGGEAALMELLAATHTGMTTQEFAASVAAWLETARHPVTERRYTTMVFQPMLELLALLHESDFKVFIVSGGGQDFMRPWVEEVYGIAPERVVGSHLGLAYEIRDGVPVLVKRPEPVLINDKAGKPVGIHRFIGRRPILAAGNSDGDFEMLEWTTSAPGPSLGLLVHHTDADREWAYDRDSDVGRLSRGLDEAADRGWLLVDMAEHWSRVYPEERLGAPGR